MRPLFKCIVLALLLGIARTGFAQVVAENFTIPICSNVEYLIGDTTPNPTSTFTWVPDFYFLNPTLPLQNISFTAGSPDIQDIPVIMREFNASGTLIRLVSYTLQLSPYQGQTQTIFEDDLCLGDTTFFPRNPDWPENFVIQPNNYIFYSFPDDGYYVFPIQSVDYFVEYVDTAACAIVTQNHRVNIFPRPQAEISTDLDRFCILDTNQYSFTVQPDSGGFLFYNSIPVDNLFSPSSLPEGDATYIYMVANPGCVGTDTVSISIIGPGSLQMSPVPNVCNNAEALPLNFGTPLGGIYRLNADTITTLDPSLLSPGSYTLTYVLSPDSGCTFEQSDVFIVIPSPPTPQIVSPQGTLACEGDTLRLWSSVFSNYEWSTGDTTQNILVDQSGWYRVRVISNTGCISNFDSVLVTFSPFPALSLSPLVYPNNFNTSAFGLNDGQLEAIVEGGLPPFQYSWTPWLPDTNIVNNLPPGSYTLLLRDSAGCEVSAQGLLEGPPEPTPEPEPTPTAGFALPNGFTPNGDGFNDRYTILGLLPDYQTNLLQVWDIRRQLVFEKQNYLNEWDGRDLNGDRLPSGTYFLVFRSEKLQGGFSTRAVDLRYE